MDNSWPGSIILSVKQVQSWELHLSPLHMVLSLLIYRAHQTLLVSRTVLTNSAPKTLSWPPRLEEIKLLESQVGDLESLHEKQLTFIRSSLLWWVQSPTFKNHEFHWGKQESYLNTTKDWEKGKKKAKSLTKEEQKIISHLQRVYMFQLQ